METITVARARETLARRTRAARSRLLTTRRHRRSATARLSSDSDLLRARRRRPPPQTRMTLVSDATDSTRPSRSFMRSSPTRRAPPLLATRVMLRAMRTWRTPAATLRVILRTQRTTPMPVVTLRALVDTLLVRLLVATLHPRRTTTRLRPLHQLRQQLQRVQHYRRTRTQPTRRSSTRRTLRRVRQRRTCRLHSRRTLRQLPQCSARSSKCRHCHLLPMAPRRRRCTRR